MKHLVLFVLLIAPSFALAHETTDPAYPHAHVIPAQYEEAFVEIEKDDEYLFIKSNGLPDHETGNFPNSGNPNSISAQAHEYRVPLNPALKNRGREKMGVIGVALNGIPFEPSTGECYEQKRRGRPMPADQCNWREEAIVNGQRRLGLDQNNAHVQPNGAYHYHSIPWGMIRALEARREEEGLAPLGDLVHVGYAADGVRLMVSKSNAYDASYEIKSGTRPRGAPLGSYDGKYMQDYEYDRRSGDLDECNGMEIEGEYIYFLTEDFPYAPRCLKGEPDESFDRKGQTSGRRARSGRR